MAQLTAVGVADISYIVPSYSSDKFPLTAVAELPGIFETECQGSLAFYKISHNGGILETKEFGPNGLRPLATIALPAYQLQLGTTRDVKTAKDIEGLKVRTTGGAMDLMMRSIGGVPVRMAAPEIYELLTRGTLDGIIFSYQSSVSYDFGKLLKSGTEGLNFGTAIFTYSIGEMKFKSLPPNVQKALVDAGEQVTREGCKRFEDGEKAATEKIKSQGMKVINFSDADKKQFDTAFKAVAEDWVKDVNKRGKPGTEVFKAFTDALAAGHWARGQRMRRRQRAGGTARRRQDHRPHQRDDGSLRDHAARRLRRRRHQGREPRRRRHALAAPMRHPTMGAMYLQGNRNKRSIVLDLKKPGGREALLRLAANADVFVHNVRPAAMARLKLGADDLLAINPRLVYASLHGFGETGPYAGRPAYDDLIQGLTALPALTGKITGEPRYSPATMADRIVGLNALHAILAALFHRERSGEGQAIEIPMFETMAGFVLGDHMSGRSFEPPIGPPGYSRLLSPDRRPYQTSDGYICALVYSDKQWNAFFRLIGLANEADRDPRLNSISARTRNYDFVYDWFSQMMKTQTTAEWMTFFNEADIPHAPLHDLDSLIDDPHLAAVGLLQTIEHPTEGTLHLAGPAATWSKTPPSIRQSSAGTWRAWWGDSCARRDLARAR